MKSHSRRKILRGILNGGVVTVALPLLDCFLNDSGTALASGESLPVRFGTWFWGLGMQEKIFVPKKVGANFDLPEEMSALAPVRDKINLCSNLAAYLDAQSNMCHFSGWVTSRTGNAPSGRTDIRTTFDVPIADKIGRSTRFKILSATSSGDVQATYSYENPNTPNTPETSPIAFYTRLFGPEFQNPNASSFTPSPQIMVRKSVLSGVMEEIEDFKKTVGSDDKARLDQYFTGLRNLEQQFERQLVRPKPIAACQPPAALKDEPRIGADSELIGARHKLMTDLMVMAVACDQTRVFNMTYAAAFALTAKANYERPHHTTTHEEPVDSNLGYQPTCSWFTRQAMSAWAYYVGAFAGVKEGAGTLLDNVLIYADSDVGYARIHAVNRMAAFTAGRAGGRVKTGLHVDAGGTPGTRLVYTAMRVMGVDVPSFGTKSNNTSKEIGEILA